jgi:hypothetical protein
MLLEISQAFALAGFFAAHSVWCVSEGETLIPLVGYNNMEGKKELHRMAAPELSEAVREGKEFVQNTTEKGTEAVPCYDGYLTLDNAKLDAIFVEIHSFRGSGFKATMAVAYSPAKDGKGFKVHRPKFIELPKGMSAAEAGEAFFQGVDSHKQGSSIWTQHLDESR